MSNWLLLLLTSTKSRWLEKALGNSPSKTRWKSLRLPTIVERAGMPMSLPLLVLLLLAHGLVPLVLLVHLVRLMVSLIVIDTHIVQSI